MYEASLQSHLSRLMRIGVLGHFFKIYFYAFQNPLCPQNTQQQTALKNSIPVMSYTRFRDTKSVAKFAPPKWTISETQTSRLTALKLGGATSAA